MDNGWIKLYRSMVKWEWYDDVPTKVLWLHLLLTANWEESKWHGQTIRAGQRVTSIGHLAEETGLTTRKVRTALEHLKKTGEVTSKSTNKYTLITIENWEKFNVQDAPIDKQKGKRQTNNRQSTDNQPTTNEEYKEIKKKKNIYIGLSSELSSAIKDFVDMRKQMKKPLTDRALELQIKNLEKLAPLDSQKAIAIVNQSIERGWLSFYELKGDFKEQANTEEVKSKNKDAIEDLKKTLGLLKEDLRKATDNFRENKTDENYYKMTSIKGEVTRIEDLIAKGEKKL